jgi:hypothetical protein
MTNRSTSRRDLLKMVTAGAALGAVARPASAAEPDAKIPAGFLEKVRSCIPRQHLYLDARKTSPTEPR